MTAIGLFSMFLGYCLIYWALQAFEGNQQDSFVTYIFPGANPGQTPAPGSSTANPPSGSPAATRSGKNLHPGAVQTG